MTQKSQSTSTKKYVIHNTTEDLYQELISSAVFFPQISKKEKDKIQPDMFHSNLPNISDIINSKKNVATGSVKEALIQITDYSRQLENLLRMKNKEIERLQFYNNFLSISAQKKEELLKNERKEFTKLKDDYTKLEAQIKDRNKKDFRTRTQPSMIMTSSVSNPSFGKANQSVQQQIIQPSPSQKQFTDNPSNTDDTISPKKDFVTQNANSKNAVSLNFPPPFSNNLMVNNSNSSPKSKQMTELDATNLIPMNSYLAGDNQTDTLKTPTIINLNLSDEDALEAYNSNESINFLHKLVKDENKFQEFIHKASNPTVSILYDKIRKTLQDSRVFFLLLIRLKKIIKASFKMTTSLGLIDALETIVDQTSKCMECDRCTVFVLDESKNELWSKVAKGTKSVIRMPANQGIAGFVATTKETLNILNAYADERFNKDFDKKTGYKTRTILCVPIIDEHTRVVGVIQCINKNNGHFTKDDEALMMMVADFSKIVIKNAVNFDEQNLEQYKLRSLLENSVYQSSIKDIDQIIIDSERKLRSQMHIDDARIVINNLNGTMSFFTETLDKITVPSSLGLAGEVLQTGEIINCFNCYNHSLFSPEVDISTNMPVLSVPLVHPRSKQSLGIIQVVNVKGIGSFYTSDKPKVFPLDQEVLHYFVKQLTVTLLTRYEWFHDIKFLEVPTENQQSVEEEEQEVEGGGEKYSQNKQEEQKQQS